MLCANLDLEEAAAEDAPGGLDARGALVEVHDRIHRQKYIHMHNI